ncbi:hypothetical protein SAMN02745691_02239 [Parasporobacterium paucivorans DSM 15970]|uniref:ABC-2 family transporter protein n=1 Tax=Parasporobacterium paucivorans DSM 15970 TaxID=1122934 RepID=A0A1M6KPG9_9FIRM|nr:hypothetical protein SAMN02745691_02239 [Parasporobacterium paucivorans DSM 15970]
MKPIKFVFREYIGFLKENYLKLILVSVLMFLVVFIFTEYIFSYIIGSAEVSLADYYLISSYPYITTICIIPISMFMMLFQNKTCLSSNEIIRLKSKSRVWTLHALSAMNVSLTSAVIYFFIVYIWGSLSTQKNVDFESSHSIFAYFNDGNTIENPSIIYICFVAFLFVFLTLLFANLFVALTNWLINNRILSNLFCYMVIFISSFKSNLLFTSSMSIVYDRWYPYENFSFYYCIVWILIFFIAGYVFSGRKEFFYEK